MGDVSKATNHSSVCAQPSRLGFMYAEYNLGFMYADGRGVARDAAEAIRLFERAAAEGVEEAKHNLAVLRRRT